MDLFLAFRFFAFLSQIINSQLSTLKPFESRVASEYNSECTLLPQKIFAFIGSDKKVKGRQLAKTYTPPDAPSGKCISLCASHKRCNAVNYKVVHDSENCLLIEASRIIETESAPGWLAYDSGKTCLPGCYRNAGQCLQQVNVTEQVTTRSDALIYDADGITDGSIYGKLIYVRINRGNELIWIRMAFGKMLRVVRVILYVAKYNAAGWDTESFAVKIGVEEGSGIADVVKARYCANDVITYPGEEKKIDAGSSIVRKDIYCYGPIEGKFVYLGKYTKNHLWEDALRLHEAIVFSEKV